MAITPSGKPILPVSTETFKSIIADGRQVFKYSEDYSYYPEGPGQKCYEYKGVIFIEVHDLEDEKWKEY